MSAVNAFHPAVATASNVGCLNTKTSQANYQLMHDPSQREQVCSKADGKKGQYMKTKRLPQLTARPPSPKNLQRKRKRKQIVFSYVVFDDVITLFYSILFST
ncbi:hypothetical protein BYT27DRAFT_6506638 [Phlegmacium glaucopus]|nr:hypothetical protein BYT27DRAFT_6506638 [Phlegmacium glaucopus]